MKDEHEYDALRSDVDNNSRRHSRLSDSSTEVGESDTEQAIRPRRQKRRSLWKKVNRYRWVIDTALLFVIVGLLVERRWKTHRSHEYELAGDISGFAPTCEQPH